MANISRRPYRRATQTRQHVLDVAGRLFCADSIRAVGIDRLAEEAQVTTSTLYRLFGSKEGLIAAYLHRADEEWFDRLERAVESGGLAQFFDELDEEARVAEYHGCPFRMALAEYPSSDSEVHCAAAENKARTRSRFRELAAAEGCLHPEATAEQLMLIMDGICASAAERGPHSPPGPGPALVRALLAGTN